MTETTDKPKPVLTTIRMPPELHAHLAAEAEQQGVSLNTWFVALLAGAAGFRRDQ